MCSRNQVHSSLRICDTFFTSFIMVGDRKKEDHVPTHLDDNDNVTALISIGGDNIKGGENIYFNGIHIDSIGDKVFLVSYKYGRIQVGFLIKYCMELPIGYMYLEGLSI